MAYSFFSIEADISQTQAGYKIIIFEGDTAKLGGKCLENSARHGTNPNATLINYRHPLTHTRLVTLGFIVKVFSRLVNYIVIRSTRFATVGCIRNAPIVENSNLPAWMQQTENFDQEVMDTSIQEPEFSHEIKVELVWDPSVPFKGKQALKNPLGIFSDVFSDSM